MNNVLSIDDARGYASALRRLGVDAKFHKLGFVNNWLPCVHIQWKGMQEYVYERARIHELADKFKQAYFDDQVEVLKRRVFGVN